MQCELLSREDAVSVDVILLYAGGAPPDEEIRGFGGRAVRHGSEAAGAGHRQLQDTSLEQEVQSMFVGV